MMLKARLRRVLVGALAAILALATTVPAYADTPTYDAKIVSAESTVTVHVYNNSNAEPSADAMGSGSAVDAGSFGSPIGGATVSYYKVGELVQYTGGGETSLKYAVSTGAVTTFDWQNESVMSGKISVPIGGSNYYLLDANELSSLLSGATSSDLKTIDGVNWTSVKDDNSDGTIDVGTIDGGLYLFIGSEMPSHTTKEIAPFFVSAPMPTDGSWNTDIHVYPKVQTAGVITINKEVHYANDANNFVQSMSANSKTPLEYRITVTIPRDVKNLSLLTVNDTIPTGLELVTGSVKVTTSDNVELDSNDYALDVSDQIAFSLEGDEGIGLDKFNSVPGGATIYITYQAKINDSASLAAPIAGTATLKYDFDVSEGGEDAATATVYTYGIDLTKTFEGATEYPSENAQFGLYTDSGCNQPVAVSGGNGVYWVDSSSETASMSVAQIPSTYNGTLTINGLAAGTYYLKEMAAPQGYGKIQDPITIVIEEGTTYADLQGQIENPTATVNGAQATINAGGSADKAGLVQLTVENQQLLFGFLPKTGDVGTFIFTAAGIGLVCAAVVYLTSRRRKNASNSR